MLPCHPFCHPRPIDRHTIGVILWMPRRMVLDWHRSIRDKKHSKEFRRRNIRLAIIHHSDRYCRCLRRRFEILERHVDARGALRHYRNLYLLRRHATLWIVCRSSFWNSNLYSMLAGCGSCGDTLDHGKFQTEHFCLFIGLFDRSFHRGSDPACRPHFQQHRTDTSSHQSRPINNLLSQNLPLLLAGG